MKTTLIAFTLLAFMACKSKQETAVTNDTTSTTYSQSTPGAQPPPTPPPPTPPPTGAPQQTGAGPEGITPPQTVPPPPPIPIGKRHGDTTISESGLKYIDQKIGNGAPPMPGHTVMAHYVGKLTNGQTFDSNTDPAPPFEFKIGVGQVIPGWDEGILSMRVGGKRRLIVPAKLGYGDRGAPPTIPPNATLIFDVELLGVK